MCYKKTTISVAYENGLRRCPCCNVQLTWRARRERLQDNLATVDHIVPRSIGGADTHENMFVMCFKCNRTRGVQCFVDFVTSRGVSKSYAESIYRKAHVASLQCIIYAQFTQIIDNRKDILKTNKKRRNSIRSVVRNYTNYFGDYLPEFELLKQMV